MSNISVITRLENKFDEFKNNRISKTEFLLFTKNSIDALENIDYLTIQKFRDFEYEYEISEFSDEDIEPKIKNIESINLEFSKWLNSLK